MLQPGRACRGVVAVFQHGKVLHESIEARAVPVFLARRGVDGFARVEFDDRAAACLYPGHAVGDVQGLTVDMRVPGRASAGGESPAMLPTNSSNDPKVRCGQIELRTRR